MNKFRIFDFLFIIICGAIFTVIIRWGNQKLLSQFSVVLAITAYFIGKYTGRTELKQQDKI